MKYLSVILLCACIILLVINFVLLGHFQRAEITYKKSEIELQELTGEIEVYKQASTELHRMRSEIHRRETVILQVIQQFKTNGLTLPEDVFPIKDQKVVYFPNNGSGFMDFWVPANHSVFAELHAVRAKFDDLSQEFRSATVEPRFKMEFGPSKWHNISFRYDKENGQQFARIIMDGKEACNFPIDDLDEYSLETYTHLNTPNWHNQKPGTSSVKLDAMMTSKITSRKDPTEEHRFYVYVRPGNLANSSVH